MTGNENGSQMPEVILEKSERVWTVTINRPQRRNALDDGALFALLAALEDAANDEDVLGIVIAGRGGLAFCAGSDLKALAEMTLPQQARHTALGQRLMQAIEQSRCLVVAAVDGYALGGGFELALACDLIVAGTTASFGLPEVNKGMIPAWGGTFRLTRAIGLARARAVLLGGETLDASAAHSAGLVLEVVTAGGATDAAVSRLERLAAQSSPEVVGHAKQLLLSGSNASAADSTRMEWLVETLLSHSQGYGTAGQ